MIGDRCEFCDGEMEQRRILTRFRCKGRTIYVEDVPAWVCKKCGEEYFNAPVYKWLEGIAEQRERMQQFETGHGDYTAERHTWLGKLTVRELVEEIERQHQAVAA